MDDQKQRIIERMGRHYESEGMPRIAGRLFGFLLLQSEPRSLDELAGSLSVSKTSVSTNARLLEQTGLLVRVTKPGDRKDYYEVAPDQARMVELRLQGIREMGEILGEAEAAVNSGDDAVRGRVRQMRRFNTEALDMVKSLLETWRGR